MAANYCQVVQIKILCVRGERVDEVGRKMCGGEKGIGKREKKLQNK